MTGFTAMPAFVQNGILKASTFERGQSTTSLAAAKKKKGKAPPAADTADDPTVEDPPAVVADPEPEPEPIVDLAAKYAGMKEEERAYNICVDLGLVQTTPDPDSPDYDSSKDDEFCDGYD